MEGSGVREPRPIGCAILLGLATVPVAIILIESGDKIFGTSGQCERIFCWSRDTETETTQYVYRGTSRVARTESTSYCKAHGERGVSFFTFAVLGWALTVGSWLFGWIVVLMFLDHVKRCIVPNPIRPPAPSSSDPPAA